MRKRYQSGSVTQSRDGRYWLGKYRENGKQRTKLLGKLDEMKEQEAEQALWDIVKPINAAANGGTENSPDITMKDYIENVYFPHKRSNFWRKLTDESRTASIQHHIIGKWGDKSVRSMNRTEIQDWLNGLHSHRDPQTRMAHQTVNGIRWGLKSIFDLASADGIIDRNPVYSERMLVTVPGECPRSKQPYMEAEQVKLAISALTGLRERLVFELIVLAGMRVSEVFGLRRGRVYPDYVVVAERVCRRDVDRPKTSKSKREVGISRQVQEDLKLWLAESPDTGSDGWLFPSEAVTTAIGSDNVMSRYMRPKLKAIGLEWVDYRVMRRTHASLMKHLKADPKMVADQQGHGVDTSLNVYTQTPVADRLPGLEQLSAFVN